VPHGAGPAPQYLVPEMPMLRDGMQPAEFIFDEVSISTAELDELARRWRNAVHGQAARIWPPLPRRTRLKLAIHRHITSAGEWLGDHASWNATERLWRITGLLGKKRK
jgi:hypothetical protein